MDDHLKKVFNFNQTEHDEAISKMCFLVEQISKDEILSMLEVSKKELNHFLNIEAAAGCSVFGDDENKGLTSDKYFDIKGRILNLYTTYVNVLYEPKTLTDKFEGTNQLLKNLTPEEIE